MAINIEYKGYVINSAPLILQKGGFSSNGSIEQHSVLGVMDHTLSNLQATTFNTEEEADNWFVEEAKTIIDKVAN
jgi:hypothetical protein